MSNSINLSDQIVLVTGGGRGLGEHLVRAFLREGAKVVINYLSSADAAQTLAALAPERAIAIQADVSCQADVQAMFEKARAHFGQPITTVINNALPSFSFNGDARANADQLTWENLNQQFSGVVGGALYTTQAALAGMREAGFGRIINVGTNLFQNPVVPYHDYTAGKAALLSLTRTMANDLGPDNITVNMVSGGLLRTTDASAATPEEVFDFIAASTPLRRVTTPAEFADATLFFASPWSRSVTGQNLVIDGGLVKD
ncbi:3-oxoacyl-ACP reductase [Pseudoalteromonas luteoviolacea]|uniref:3-ketoacyl-ACP reductase n=1 Tax=Pseudoalteromonas luteoviolacea S4054 TaxID=1129367 RepID=A0A0F6AGW7_9GAMM|nr:3-oxoacyl-ACP reductase [Pseudoalteromonas luteoviolacea]AOT08855.1 3-oxoacyl-ACP reductase [Pseudoalteromonas luteoviolacea]AOT13768.1 3-oxoacyl-ACP reductase [Pseudoalteromonas luteoviolacea]AOT18682.1 3-oxoacyl-ACP reductase [Pseudoalteromonas luteoviolacea]KKE85465.1 3-ketoacyl-ACP reductase [Pseudoalteromonas luteoviolacea S4054]KZN67979.1 3-ketoacyl-ACP reductase [Pseudoalteromonas luteoviolacea S4047-1]